VSTSEEKTIRLCPIESDILETVREMERETLGEVHDEVRKGITVNSSAVKIELRVEDSRQRDVARGIVRIDQETMEKLAVHPGDVVEIIGKRKTSAVAWPAYSEDQGRGIIRIDEFSRKNAGVSMNEYVIVRCGEVKDATRIVLAPADMRLNVDEDFTSFVKNRLMERTFVEGDTILVMMIGHPVRFTVTKTRPHGIVRLTHNTDAQILAEPLPLPPPTVEVELTSVNELDNLNVEIEVLEKGYDILNKSIELKFAVIVRFNNLVQTGEFDTYLDESTKLSDLLDAYRKKALNELESIKTDIKKRSEQIGFPISISLSDIKKVITEKVERT